VLDLEGDFYALSETAAGMLQAVIQTDLDSAVQRIAQRFHADAHQVRRDLELYTKQLVQAGVLRSARSADGERQPRLPTAFLGLLWTIHHVGLCLDTQVWWLLLLAYVAVRRWGWPATVRCWQRFYRECGHDDLALANSQEWIDRIETTVCSATARHLLPVACKERALCGWGLLRAHGLPAKLVLGVELFPLASHCWCQLGERVVGDWSERCRRFTPVTSYD
jgi:hypothetical protein